MKYSYASNTPSVLLIDGELITVRKGDEFNFTVPPTTDFLRSNPPKKKSLPKALPPQAENITDGKDT